jgi:hypothetical protein
MKKNIRRGIWGVFFAFFLYLIIYFLLKKSNYIEGQCYIDRIDYPKSFEDQYVWKNCTCDTDFCTKKCYCVKLYSSMKKDLVIENNNGDDKNNCTFESNIIPYKLNFEPIITNYMNKTVNCWYDNSYTISEIYLDYKENNIVIFIVLLIFLLALNIICLFTELADNYSVNDVFQQEIYEIDEGVDLN